MKSTLLKCVAVAAVCSMAPGVTHAELTCTFDPPSGTTMQAIKGIDVWCGVMLDSYFFDSSKVYLTNEANEKIPCTGFNVIMTDYTRYAEGGTLSFNATAAGTYTLTI